MATEEQKVTEQLKSEKLFQLAVEASPNGILLMDDAGNIALVNSKIEEIFGYSRNELINQSVSILVPLTYRDLHPTYRIQFLNNPKARAMGMGRDLYGLHKNGHEVPLEIGLNPLEINDRTHVLASVVDISERKQAEKERKSLSDRIQMAQRMESLGVLAGGTAHDFNNILYAISGNAELAQMRASMGENIDLYLSNIIRSCTRASDLTKQMLAYAGKGKIIFGTVQLNELIHEMLALLESSIPKDIKITRLLDTNLPSIEADSSQLQQIIMNLVTNAYESIGDQSGEITIKTGVQYETLESLKSYRAFDYLREGEYIFLEVSDTGAGMSQEIINNMFDPFYTTKFTGRGLGMAAVLGIIRSHFGTVQVKSEIDKGATIRILFPITSNDTEAYESFFSENERTALIVDDEPEVRDVLKQMLEVSNFKVAIAKSGNEAIKKIDARESEYDLIVLDMNMPGMSGADVYEEFKKREVTSKLIFISGYSEEELIPLFDSGTEDNQQFPKNFLHKPFKYNDIKEMIDRLFDTRQ